MQKRVLNMKGAPANVIKWWSRTGFEKALLRMVEKGMTWEQAHLRGVQSWQWWWDRGRKGTNPLLRYSNMVYRKRVLEDWEAGRLKGELRRYGGKTYVCAPMQSRVLAPARLQA